MKEVIGTDVNGKPDFTLPLPTACDDLKLTANTIVGLVTPANFNRAYFSYAVGTNVWVTFDGSNPVVPTTAVHTTQELLPAGRQIPIAGLLGIKFISDTASFVNIRYDIA